MSSAINLAAAMAVGSCCCTRSLHAARQAQWGKVREEAAASRSCCYCWYCLLARLVQLMRLAGCVPLLIVVVIALLAAVVVRYQQVLNFNLQFIAY